jgi:chromosome segregation ATPase
MLRSLFLVPALLLISPSAFGQTSTTDSQSLQALLAEVRQLRQDLRTTTMAAQRVQILLFRLQVQEAAVARVQRRVDEAQSDLAQHQFELKRLASTIKSAEDAQGNNQNPAERKDLEQMLPTLKERFESSKEAELQLQAKEVEAEQELRAEKAKLAALEEQLDRLDKSLEISKP